jgi:hypothetical protein
MITEKDYLEAKRIVQEYESKHLNISDVRSSKNTWLEEWKVIDLLELVSEIAGGVDLEEHPVYEEWEYQVQVRGKGNDSGNLEWVGQNKKTPLINNFLLNNGFKQDEKVIFYLSW